MSSGDDLGNSLSDDNGIKLVAAQNLKKLRPSDSYLAEIEKALQAPTAITLVIDNLPKVVDQMDENGNLKQAGEYLYLLVSEWTTGVIGHQMILPLAAQIEHHACRPSCRLLLNMFSCSSVVFALLSRSSPALPIRRTARFSNVREHFRSSMAARRAAPSLLVELQLRSGSRSRPCSITASASAQIVIACPPSLSVCSYGSSPTAAITHFTSSSSMLSITSFIIFSLVVSCSNEPRHVDPKT